MYCYNDYPNIVIDLDGDSPTECAQVIESLAYSASCDFINLTNEGFPVYLGNSYARYEFIALNDGLTFTYPFGPNELKELVEKGELTISPLGWNDLDEVKTAFSD